MRLYFPQKAFRDSVDFQRFGEFVLRDQCRLSVVPPGKAPCPGTGNRRSVLVSLDHRGGSGASGARCWTQTDRSGFAAGGPGRKGRFSGDGKPGKSRILPKIRIRRGRGGARSRIRGDDVVPAPDAGKAPVAAVAPHPSTASADTISQRVNVPPVQ